MALTKTMCGLLLMGVTWTEVKANNNVGWSKRSAYQSVVFNNKIWVLGGNDGSAKNDVWSSSDGSTWTEVKVSNSAGWPKRSAHQSVVFDNGKIWVLGGANASFRFISDVWSSSDGITWKEVKANNDRSAWTFRNHSSIRCV